MTQTKLTLHLIFEKWLQKFGYLFASRSLSPFLSLFPFVLNEWKIPLFNFGQWTLKFTTTFHVVQPTPFYHSS